MIKIKFFFNIIFITLTLFILINFFLAWTWEISKKIKFKNYKPYDDVVLKSLKLNEEEALALYLETFIEMKFDYEQFTEHAENNGYNNKFVNVTPKLGRKTISPYKCEKNIFFYGGSTTFGYNVTDSQTIPSYLGKKLILDNHNICVKNFGRGSYFSTQETILFQKHILDMSIKDEDIIIFLDGINENGNQNSNNTQFLFKANQAINQKYWDMYKYTFLIFLNSLPISQFINRIYKKYNLNSNENHLVQKNIFQLQNDIKSVYENNVKIRNAICKKMNLNCYNLLQPFASVHGKYFEKKIKGAIQNKILNIDQKKKLFKKYELLKNSSEIIDISGTLNNSRKLSYIDSVHYSPDANKLIAFKIFDIISDRIN